eukprot:4677482-Amphidinium_carterae.1
MQGVILPVLGEWQMFDSRRPHGVLPFVSEAPNAVRFSFTLFSPRRLQVVGHRLWRALQVLGFPTGDVQSAGVPVCVAHGDGRPRTPKGKKLARGRATTVLGGLTAATLVSNGNAECLDCCWARAMWQVPPTAFTDFFESALLRQCPPSQALRCSPFENDIPRAVPASDQRSLYPCGLPFVHSMDSTLCTPPSSGRRLQRWRRKRRIHAMVNSAVAYLSWLALGRPASWPSERDHPLCADLSTPQRQMCLEMVQLFSAVCRPGETFVAPGGGLSHFIEALEAMGLGDVYQASAGPCVEPSPALPLITNKVSLPVAAAQCDLLHQDVLPQRLQDYLRDPSRLLKPVSGLVGPQPRMYMDVEDWDLLASELWERSMTRWIPASQVPTVRGSDKRAGLFGVTKSNGTNLRMIVDRRPANWSEYSLRDLLLQDLGEQTVGLEEFEQLWRLMCLPYPGSLQDLFLGREGEVRVTVEDCSDYFYSLRLPHHWHPHTTIGWNLPRHAIPSHQLAADLTEQEIANSQTFAAALR